jgi:hypothetical protein
MPQPVHLYKGYDRKTNIFPRVTISDPYRAYRIKMDIEERAGIRKQPTIIVDVDNACYRDTKTRGTILEKIFKIVV